MSIHGKAQSFYFLFSLQLLLQERLPPGRFRAPALPPCGDVDWGAALLQT